MPGSGVIYACEINKEYYVEWHAAYREYQHIRLGGLKDIYDREVLRSLAEILIHCGSSHYEFYQNLIKKNDRIINGVHMGIVTNAAFFLYEKNYKRIPMPIRVLSGIAIFIVQSYKK